MESKRDYYEVLGVDKNASDADIKSAFRKKAKNCHPDLHPGDAAKEAEFKELNEAYEVLSDPEKREKYDQFGHAAFDPAMGGGNPFTGATGFDGFGDIFSTIFGGFGAQTQNRNAPMTGDDIRYNLTLSFEEAAFGAEKELNVTREEVCDVCGGTGAKPGTQPQRCHTCKGTGQVRIQQNTLFGTTTINRPCSACRGTGKIISEPCAECRGKGRVRRLKRLSLKIPAGIDDGQTINMRNEGDAGYKGGPRGNLYVTISVRPHAQFVRRGSDLLLTMNIPYTTAALGGEIVVPTLTGQIKYNVPQGTQIGTTFRLREQGIQKLQQQGKGDLFVTVNVEVPKKITPQERAILEQLAALEGKPVVQKNKKRPLKDIFK
ncbi:MAG: molecular chaperone DnaJ [Clostridia bacterium]|nr:molecular chaperone DnaJ [Clostridia bacterium]MBR3130055.1 molecular chaperone DnaJ [Clostridia bacterium]